MSAAGEPRPATRGWDREHDRVLDEYREFVEVYGRPSGDKTVSGKENAGMARPMSTRKQAAQELGKARQAAVAARHPKPTKRSDAEAAAAGAAAATAGATATTAAAGL